MKPARRGLSLLVAVMLTAGLGGVIANRADAEPSGETRYPAGATATRFAGQAFDVCAAPSLSTMQGWKSASPYGAIGIYISGGLRACRQPNLTASWVRDVTAMGWKLIPIDVGLQAPCTTFSQRISSKGSTARKQGERAGAASIQAARSLGILPGSALYSDIENYDSRDVTCSGDVHAYLNGWTRAMHGEGYLSGVYGNLGTVVRDVLNAQRAANDGKSKEGPIRPDMLWNAQWDRTPSTTWRGVETHLWAAHQRIKQYRGDHRETHGGVTLNIDSNTVDAAVATVARSISAPTGIEFAGRVAPNAAAAARAVPAGTLQVVCQAHTFAASSSRWVQTVEGAWIPEAVLTDATALATVASLPTCSTPFQVMPGVMPLRTLPAETGSAPGGLAGGTLAWAVCEQPGLMDGRTGYWLRLETGQWIAGAHLTRADRYGDAEAIPACPK